MSTIPSIEHVAIDPRLNDVHGKKFQPDLMAYRWPIGAEVPEPLLFVDYESPSSSDARIVEKDIKPYLKWVDQTESPVPYVIVTTLPRGPTPTWELRWTGADRYNRDHRGKRDDVRACPLTYWLDCWRKTLDMGEHAEEVRRLVAIVNLDGKKASVVPF